MIDAADLGDICREVELAGPGFINLTFDEDHLARSVATVATDPRLGLPRADHPERVVVDYSAPNIAKEMHVGHLRSTIIGDALVRLLACQGHRVIRQNHVGDWGTPFGMLIEHLVESSAPRPRRQRPSELVGFYQAGPAQVRRRRAFADRARGRVVPCRAAIRPPLPCGRA